MIEYPVDLGEPPAIMEEGGHLVIKDGAIIRRECDKALFQADLADEVLMVFPFDRMHLLVKRGIGLEVLVHRVNCAVLQYVPYPCSLRTSL